MPQNIVPPGYSPSFIIPRSEKEIARQRALAQAMMEQSQGGPIQSHWQGAARLANALGGAIGNYQAGQMEQERQSALAQALRSGSIDQLYASGEPTLIDVAQAREQRQRFEAQQAAQEAHRQQQQSNWETEQAAQAERARATEERLGRTFTPATPEDMQKYGPDYLGKNPQGEPQFRPATRGPTVKEYDREDGTKGLAQYNESTGKWYDITPVEGQGDAAAAPPAAAPATSPNAGAAPAPPKPRKIPNLRGLNESESKSAFYYRRARNSLKKITPEMSIRLTSPVEAGASYLAGFVGAENMVTTDQYQLAKTRYSNIVAALNRKDSGAAVTPEEWRMAFQNWVPLPGQSAAVVAEKQKNLAAAVAALKGTAGKGVAILDQQDRAYDDAYETMGELKKRYGDQIPDQAKEMVRQKLRDMGVDPLEEEF